MKKPEGSLTSDPGLGEQVQLEEWRWSPAGRYGKMRMCIVRISSVTRKWEECVAEEDDSISAASASDVQDRLSSLELRVQQQEDEITVMKAALADVLRRLALSEDSATTKKQSTSKAGQNPLREAFSMSCITNGSSSGRKPSHRDGSSVSIARKETLSSAAKSSCVLVYGCLPLPPVFLGDPFIVFQRPREKEGQAPDGGYQGEG
ncbi:hypothetical protein Z043_103814 [Scleropages formosus]|uniref:Echinoderm microtubule-associated protein-like 1-like n=1 Tax=Scleropages formosus TaxID=113540 RepID=A0A0P7V2S1_SCLFO|nr:hypothetical protein Z043_103814 [Scleropages formosus]